MRCNEAELNSRNHKNATEAITAKVSDLVLPKHKMSMLKIILGTFFVLKNIIYTYTLLNWKMKAQVIRLLVVSLRGNV